MAFKYGNAGMSTRKLPDMLHGRKLLHRVYSIILIVVSIITVFIFLISKDEGIAVLGGFIIAMILLPTTREVDKYSKLEKRAAKGAKAEEEIGDILHQLPDAYAVFHDINSPYGNIDHVILNKENSIFLLETKSHWGKVTYNGTSLLINEKHPEKNFIKQTFNNVFWLKEELRKQTGLNVYVKAVIVFTNAFVGVTGTIKGISVINKKHLIESILKEGIKKKDIEKDQHEVGLFTILYRLQKSATTDMN